MYQHVILPNVATGDFDLLVYFDWFFRFTLFFFVDTENFSHISLRLPRHVILLSSYDFQDKRYYTPNPQDAKLSALEHLFPTNPTPTVHHGGEGYKVADWQDTKVSFPSNIELNISLSAIIVNSFIKLT